MLKIKGLRKEFVGASGETIVAVADLDLDIPGGAFFTLLGPSGCGKTTTLRCVAGLEKPNEGEIEVSEQTIFSSSKGVFVPPYQREMGMVFQSYAIWPHMDVYGNVSFPLDTHRGYSKQEKREKVREALALVGMEGYENRPATRLSGGQQQRVALARAVVAEARILLLDEPLSNLDAKLREETRFELRSLHTRLGLTTLYVTHDQTEALAMSDQIAVMRDGRLLQLGTPSDLYHRPVDSFVAEFMGIRNRITGTARSHIEGSIYLIDTEYGNVKCSVLRPVTDGATVEIFIRPHDLLCNLREGEYNLGLRGQIRYGVFLGDGFECVIDVGGNELRGWLDASDQITSPEGQDVWLDAAPMRCIGIPIESPEPIEEDDPNSLQVQVAAGPSTD